MAEIPWQISSSCMCRVATWCLVPKIGGMSKLHFYRHGKNIKALVHAFCYRVPLFAVKQNGTLVDSSPLQVIASQLVVTKGRSDIGRAILFPGALVKDGVHWALTNFGGDKSGKEPAKLADWDSILNSTSPLYNPEVLVTPPWNPFISTQLWNHVHLVFLS